LISAGLLLARFDDDAITTVLVDGLKGPYLFVNANDGYLSRRLHNAMNGLNAAMNGRTLAE
tara:strand:- start:384 stop:566 length:183 start_codon:yes stop_codon:yes gene_type:complete